MRSLIVVLFVIGVAVTDVHGFDVLTYHNDLARTGLNPDETILTPQNVNSAQFGRLFQYNVDGYVYAQPLYVSNVQFPDRGPRNVVYVATQHDSVYAFDADGNLGTNAQPLWKVSFINPSAGITTVPSTDVYTVPNPDIVPEIGITGTPVIDRGSGTLYVVSFIKANGSYAQHLHALDIVTGQERSNSPMLIQATMPGSATDAVNGTLSFRARSQLQRASLLLFNNTVYIAWASFGDAPPYHGWVMSYDATTLQQKAVYVDTPNGQEGGIWMGSGAPSVDPQGNIYLITGNGTFNVNSGGSDYGDSVLRLNSDSLQVVDYFTPYNQATLEAQDLDLGSSGALLLPDQPGAHPHLLIMGGKEGTLYVLDRDNLGKFNSAKDAVVQTLPKIAGGIFGTPAYFNGSVYLFGQNAFPSVYPIQNGLLQTTPTSRGNTYYPRLGASPSISANGTAAGIVWAIERAGTGGVLHAHDAGNLSNEPFNSNQVTSRDALGPGSKFAPPTVANGKVYVGTTTSLTVYGLLSTRLASPPVLDSGPVATPVSVNWPGTTSLLQAFAHDTNTPALPLTYTWSVLSGPAGVTFTSNGNASTMATFAWNGTYSILVSASNGHYAATGTVTITVQGNPNPPPGATPGGADPNNQPPGSDPNTLPTLPLAIARGGLKIQLNFSQPQRDSVTLNATVASTELPVNSDITLTIGGLSEQFSLDGKGRANRTDTQGRYTVRFTKIKTRGTTQLRIAAQYTRGTFAAALAAQGFVNSTVSSLKASVPVNIILGGNTYHADAGVKYSSRAQKTGSAR